MKDEEYKKLEELSGKKRRFNVNSRNGYDIKTELASSIFDPMFRVFNSL